MLKRISGILLSLAIMLSLGSLVDNRDIFATDADENMQLRYSYISTHNTSLAISNGQAICQSSITGYPGTTTKISITMHLEKKVLWWWSNQTTWTQTFIDYRGSLSKTYSIGSGTYRVRTVFVAYNNSNSETVTGYSSEVTY